MMNIGSRLRTLREQQGLSMMQLARQLETYKKTIYTWEHDIFVPSAPYLKRLAGFYGVSVDSIVFGSAFDGGSGDLAEHTVSELLEWFRGLPSKRREQALTYLKLTYELADELKREWPA